MLIDKDRLVGRWAIREWVQEYDDGRKTHPLGTELVGFLEYGATRVTILIERAGRAHFVSGGQWNASQEERAGAYDGFFVYSGTYRIDGDSVVHEIESSLFPNWEGGTQRRRARLEGNSLHLLARLEEGTPEARTAKLIWDRCKPDRDERKPS